MDQVANLVGWVFEQRGTILVIQGRGGEVARVNPHQQALRFRNAEGSTPATFKET
jgi:hypothetical protein